MSSPRATTSEHLPFVEAWPAPEQLMTAQRAVQLGEALASRFQGPVDFFRI